MLNLFRLILLVPIFLFFVRQVVTLTITSRYLARARREAATRAEIRAVPPSVSIIVPVRGIDEGAEENFRALCDQVYPGPLEVLFCVEEADDPVLPLLERLVAETPQGRARLVSSGSVAGRSMGKLRNLIAGVAASTGEMLVFVDSDVRLPASFLAEAVPAIYPSEVGLAFASPVGIGTADWVAALHNLAVNESVLNMVPAAVAGNLQSAIGSLMVLRREALEASGGLAALEGRVVGIDVSLAQLLVQHGYQIRLLAHPAPLFHPHDTLPRWWAQMVRWMVTIRAYFPIFVPVVLLVETPLICALLRWATRPRGSGPSQQYPLIVLTILTARLASAAYLNASFVRDPALWRYLWVAPLLEFFRIPALLYSSRINTVMWRGRPLQINQDATAQYLAPDEGALG